MVKLMASKTSARLATYLPLYAHRRDHKVKSGLGIRRNRLFIAVSKGIPSCISNTTRPELSRDRSGISCEITSMACKLL